MDKHRKFIEKTYVDKCTIAEYKKYTKSNKSTGYRETIVLKSQPCRISFSNIRSSNQTNTGDVITQSVKLFIAPEIIVKSGSKITVYHHSGRILIYKNSGEPGLYSSHQEINLELFERWA